MTQSNLAISMPMFAGGTYDIHQVVADLQHHWQLGVDESSLDGDVAMFYIDGAMIAVALMPAPIPMQELEPLFSYAYLWHDVDKQVPQHSHHAIVSVMNATDAVHAHTLLTKVNASILRSCEHAIGVYQGSATLLLPKGLYCDFADFLLDGALPVILWIYVGLINHADSRSLYTYGLANFGRMEMEIIDSPMLASELHDFILPVMAYLLSEDIYLHDGESIGFSAEHKIYLTQSDGVHLDGQTLKLAL